jgi:hypothetical protein
MSRKKTAKNKLHDMVKHAVRQLEETEASVLAKLKQIGSPCYGCAGYCGVCDLEDGILLASVQCQFQGGSLVNLPKRTCALFVPISQVA